MRVYKRGKRYWFELVFEGKRYRKATKHTNKVEASGAAAAFRTALANRNFGIVERKIAPSVKDAMEGFLAWSAEEHKEHPATTKRYTTSSKPLLVFFKKGVDQITPADIEDYKVRRAGQKVKKTKRYMKPATINRELACLKAMFNYVVKDRHDFRNPVSDVEFLPENNEQTRVLSFDEQQRYLAATGSTLKDVATLMVETGCRPEEIYRITAANVALDQGFLQIPFGKTKAARRRIPLTSTARAILKARVKAAKGAYLFPHRSDPDKPTWKVANAHTRALKASKVPAFRLYDLSHTWATRAAEAGMDMPTLAALLGHSKLNMVMRYAHPQEQHQADAMKKLETFNAERQIAEAEKKAKAQARRETVPTVFPTTAENSADFLVKESEGKSQRIN